MTIESTALVAGAGIAGTVTALALHRAGLTPVLYEAYERGADDRGAFLTVAVNGLAALRHLDIDPTRLLAAGFATPTLAMANAAGRHLVDLPLGGPTPDGTITTTIRRADLYTALRAEAERRGIPVRYGRRLIDVQRHPEAVTAVFGDGTTATGALLVGADGLRSRVRALLDPAGPAPRYLGLLNAGGFTSRPVRADLDRAPGVVHMAFGRRCFFGWTSAPDGTIWWFANPPRRREPAPAEVAGWEPARWRAHLMELFADDAIPAQAIIEATDDILGPWNTYDLPRVPVWQDGRTVLLGDAAHAMSPSAGQGASMAIEDAVVLGRCLSAVPDVPAALAAYERLRRTRVERVVAHGKRNGNPKTAGPVAGAIRDRIMPLMMRLLYRNGDPQAWILDHRVDAVSAGRDPDTPPG